MITYSMKNNSLVQEFMKANLEKFQFMILSKTRCPEYNLSIDSNVMSDESESNNFCWQFSCCFMYRIYAIVMYVTV